MVSMYGLDEELAPPLRLWPLRVAHIIVCFIGSALGTVLMLLCTSHLFLRESYFVILNRKAGYLQLNIYVARKMAKYLNLMNNLFMLWKSLIWHLHTLFIVWSQQEKYFNQIPISNWFKCQWWMTCESLLTIEKKSQKNN